MKKNQTLTLFCHQRQKLPWELPKILAPRRNCLFSVVTAFGESCWRFSARPLPLHGPCPPEPGGGPFTWSNVHGHGSAAAHMHWTESGIASQSLTAWVCLPHDFIITINASESTYQKEALCVCELAMYIQCNLQGGDVLLLGIKPCRRNQQIGHINKSKQFLAGRLDFTICQCNCFIRKISGCILSQPKRVDEKTSGCHGELK